MGVVGCVAHTAAIICRAFVRMPMLSRCVKAMGHTLAMAFPSENDHTAIVIVVVVAGIIVLEIISLVMVVITMIIGIRKVVIK